MYMYPYILTLYNVHIHPELIAESGFICPIILTYFRRNKSVDIILNSNIFGRFLFLFPDLVVSNENKLNNRFSTVIHTVQCLFNFGEEKSSRLCDFKVIEMLNSKIQIIWRKFIPK